MEKNKIIWPCHLVSLLSGFRVPPQPPSSAPPNIEQLFHVGSSWLQIISFTLGLWMDCVTEQLPKLPPLNSASLRGELILIIAVKILGGLPRSVCQSELCIVALDC